MKRASRFAVIDTSQWPLKAAKWPVVSERLQGLRVVPARRVIVPAELDGSHDRVYVSSFVAGALGESAMRRIGIAFSEALLERVFRVTGATLQAAEMVLEGSAEDVAVVGGGAHHAHFDFGAGFCVFNDLTAAALLLAKNGKRVFICDLDVHQGDGTIAILNRHQLDNVFLLDISCESNFPLRKQVPERNGIVLQLADGIQDDAYIEQLRQGLAAAQIQFGCPDVVLYQGGVDPLESDALGKFALSMEGLRRRDATVYEWAKRNAASVISTCGGGYSKDAETREIVISAHVQQIRELAFYS